MPPLPKTLSAGSLFQKYSVRDFRRHRPLNDNKDRPDDGAVSSMARCLEPGD